MTLQMAYTVHKQPLKSSTCMCCKCCHDYTHQYKLLPFGKIIFRIYNNIDLYTVPTCFCDNYYLEFDTAKITYETLLQACIFSCNESFLIYFLEHLENLVSCKWKINSHHLVMADQQEIKHEDTK